MTLGSRTRRGSAGLAAWTLVALLGGCHAMPVARIAPSPNRPQSTLASAGRAALLPATVAMDPPAEMSSMEPVASSPGSLTPAENPSRPTPLLDAALERAKGLDEIIAVGMAKPASQPAPTPAIAAPDQIQLPPANPPPRAEPVALVSASPTTMPPPSPDPARPKAKEPTPEPEPARPEDLWREGVRRLGGLARARLEQSGGSSPAAPWALRARVLAWLAEPDIDPDLGQRESDGVRAVLRALDEPPVDSTRRGDVVRSAVLVLEDKAPLEIVDLRLCSKAEGFGDFVPFDPPVRKAGEPVVLYCELDGLRFEQTSAGFRTRVAAQLEILPEGGGPSIQTRSLDTVEETCRRRRRDYYVVYRLSLPKPLPPGSYRIRLTERDLTSDRSATREVAFSIAKD